MDLIKKALDEAFVLLQKQVPQTKKETKSIEIDDVKPIDLIEFMKDNNIPDTAYFDSSESHFNSSILMLSWQIDIPTTEKEKLEYKNRRFHDIAFSCVYKSLTSNGYKRVSGYDHKRITYKKIDSIRNIILFDQKSIYDIYMDKGFDKLIEYYSMYFQKNI